MRRLVLQVGLLLKKKEDSKYSHNGHEVKVSYVLFLDLTDEATFILLNECC